MGGIVKFSASGSISTTGEGSIENNVVGAGIDISAEIKVSTTNTISLDEIF